MFLNAALWQQNPRINLDLCAQFPFPPGRGIPMVSAAADLC